MTEPQESGMPGRASPGEIKATQKIAKAQAAVHPLTLRGSLLRLGAVGAAVYTAWYLWQHAEELLPEPVSEVLSKAVSVGGGAMQQRVEEARGTYPGSAGDMPNRDRQEAAKQQR